MKYIFFSCLLFSVSVIQAQGLRFHKTIKEDSIKLDLINDTYAPIHIQFEKVTMYEEDLRLPSKIVINPRDSLYNLVALPLRLMDTTVKFDYKPFFSVNAVLGDPNMSKHEEGYLYGLPYMPEKAYSVLQGWNGKFSHRSKQSKYAIDFKMPIGDTVCAAREGVVALIKDKFKSSGGREMKDKANQIVVLHNDGTLAYYVHLDFLGALVNPGEKVKKGQKIGLSGNTGFSTRPHLHFVVREAPDKSVPIYFEGYSHKRLKKNRRYLRSR